MASLPNPSQLQQQAKNGEVLFSGYMLKAGDDNSRWKSRFFQLTAQKFSPPRLPSTTSTTTPNGAVNYYLRYFENDRDAVKLGKVPRGEILVSDVVGMSVFPTKTNPTNSPVDSNLQLLGELTSDHVQEGPTKLLLFCKTRLWRLAELSFQGSTIAELVRALDKILLYHPVSRFSIRMVGWMRAQGSLSWNRRYAMLFSNGELLMFLDQNLDQLRRRIDLSQATDIRSKQPLASSGSAGEKRVLRLLNLSIQDSNSNVWSVDMSDILGIRLLHPLIPEKTGYIMCMERQSVQEDPIQLYARFRKWIVQLQLSAAESRLSEFVATSSSSSQQHQQQPQRFSLEDDEDGLLERKLLQIYQQSNSAEVSKTIAWEYLVRFGAFLLVHRANLWLVLFNGQSFKRQFEQQQALSYAALVAKEEGRDPDEVTRICSALSKVILPDQQQQPQHVPRGMIDMLLRHGGEECAFWTLVGMSHTPNMFHKRQGFALLVEAHVIVDLLGMKHPQLIAHLSSYDLIKSLLTLLSDEFLPELGCPSLPQIWDGASVVGGRDALSFCTVHLLSDRAGEMAKCFAADELLAVVRRALGENELPSNANASTPGSKFPWRDFDPHLAQRLRKAQWNSIVVIMREHSQMLRSWKLVAGEIKNLAVKAIAQCNRFSPEQEVDFETVHRQAVQLHLLAAELFYQAESCERALEHRMLRSVGGLDQGNQGSGEEEDGYPIASNLNASATIPQLEQLSAHLTCFAMTCLSLGWKMWWQANQIASQHRFIPRASLASSFYPNASTTLLNSSTSEEPQPFQDVSSIKSLANEIRRRLFNPLQQPLPAVNTAAGSTINSGPPSPTQGERVPCSPDLEAASPQFLLQKFNGGFIGLCEFAASSVDAAFAKDKQLRNVKLIRLLDILDVMIKISSFSNTLQRWLVRRCSMQALAVKRDMPSEVQHLFLAGQVQFHLEDLKALDSALVEIQQRCSSGAKNCTV
ncbi:hypothetical protein BASA81_002688 [Batrachochytrium salamandrivorans]|nr:hypothetical protein BASA81_002688 [Batrachochytrium salamandrivorans]